MSAYRKNNKGFTLVEILIVVIILGILAAIVIPQFTNASTDARKNSLSSQLQTMRSQFELYKLQHNDKLPAAFLTDGSTDDWSLMVGQSDVDGNTTGANNFGPYLQQKPTNSLNGHTSILVGTTEFNYADPSGSTTDGWLLNKTTGKVWATSTAFTKVYDESNPSNTSNDQ